MSDYALAVNREEADELADQILLAITDMALPGARMGVGIAALLIAIRRLIDTLPEGERHKARENVAFLIKTRTWRREYP